MIDVDVMRDRWLEPPELPFNEEPVAYCYNCDMPIYEDEFFYPIINGMFFCSQCGSCGVARREE